MREDAKIFCANDLKNPILIEGMEVGVTTTLFSLVIFRVVITIKKKKIIMFNF